MARHEIDYKRPLVHRHEPVTIESWVTKIGAASLTIAYEIKDPRRAARCTSRASTVVVPYDLAAGRPRRITAEEKSFLLEYLDDGDKSDAKRDGKDDGKRCSRRMTATGPDTGFADAQGGGGSRRLPRHG